MNFQIRWDIIQSFIMMNFLIRKSNNRFIKYCIFGSLISILEIILYYVLAKYLHIYPLLSNAIAFLVSVSLSFYANSKYVFKTMFISKKNKIKSFCLFLSSRVIGLFVDSSILYLLLYINCSNLIAKTISCISTTIINYFMGKYIFK